MFVGVVVGILAGGIEGLQCSLVLESYYLCCGMLGSVEEGRQLVGLCLYDRLHSHRVPAVLWSSSFLVLVHACFALADVEIFGLLGVCFILTIFVHEGLAAREG